MVRASGICLEGPGFNPQSGHLSCLTKSSHQDTSVGSKQLPDPASSVHTLGQNKKHQADSEVEFEQLGNKGQEEGLAEKKKRLKKKPQVKEREVMNDLRPVDPPAPWKHG